MKLLLYLLLLVSLALNSTYASTINTESSSVKPIVMSLGFNCVTANMLRKYEVREFATPFDWMYSSLDGICQCIDEKFQDFLNPQYLVVDGGAILNTKYILSFCHDFPYHPDEHGRDLPVHNWRDFIDEIAIKYSRRIERFCDMMNSGKLVYLIRTPSLAYWPLDRTYQNKDAIKKLRDCLSRAFPTSNFVIIALSSDPSYLQDWHLDRIRNVYFQDVTSEIEWEVMLKTMNLVATKDSQ